MRAAQIVAFAFAGWSFAFIAALRVVAIWGAP